MSGQTRTEKARAARDPELAALLEGWETVIGLEVHVQLGTRTKLFCDCANEFGASPNANTCPICLGYPGVLPVPNEEALHLGVRAALMLGCDVQEHSKFDRKHYFYPDLPKGYQISQYDLPFARGGRVELSDGRTCELERIHLEEDAGKNLHKDDHSVVDCNRAGVPLIEIVGRPDLRSPEEAHDWLEQLKRAMRYAGVSECDMEKGSLRCDANVSVRRSGDAELGTKVEIKNLNSFSMVERSLEHEFERQVRTLTDGGAIVQETRLWDDAAGETRAMRKKEGLADYRYFPEPDIPPLRLAPEVVARFRGELVESHWSRQRRFRDALGLNDYDAGVLTAERDVADYFEATLAELDDAKLVANWVQTEVLREANESGTRLDAFAIGPARLAALLREVAGGGVSHQGARKVFRAMVERPDAEPRALIDDLGLGQINDPAALEPIVRAVVSKSDKAVADWRNGKAKALDSMKGMVMRETRGRANPNLVSDILDRVLAELP